MSGPYRLSLASIRGQDAAMDALRALAASEGPVPPLLLHGPEGVGKRSAAMAFAASLVCMEQGDGLACGRCRACSRVQHAGLSTEIGGRRSDKDSPESYPDVGLVSIPKGKTRISIQQARDVIHSMSSRPFELARRIYVIDPAERMTAAGANSLLKLLEEPPLFGVLVLVTSSPWSLPITVRSRVRPLRFAPLSRDVVRDLLMEREGLDRDQAERRALRARGSMARAMAIDPEEERRATEGWVDVLAALPGHSCPAALAVGAGEIFGAAPDDALRALELLLEIVRDVHAGSAGAPPRQLNDDELARLAPMADALTGPALDRVRRVEELHREIVDFNRNPRLAVEGAVLALAGLN